MDLSPRLPDGFFARDVLAVARALIGTWLWVGDAGGRIVETEAYHHEDPASHSFGGPRPRTAVMFGPVGRIYVYRSYGVHWCMNLVAGEGPGSAVLIRALEPLEGLDDMRARRGVQAARQLCSGPGKLCEALGVTGEHNGAAADEPPFRMGAADGAAEVVVGPRIGISKAAEKPWRFGLADSPYLSRPFPRG